MDDRTYPSKVDTWVSLLLAVSAVALIGAVILATVQGEILASVVLSVSMAVYSAVLLGVGFPCRYTLTSDALLIQSGFLRFRLPYTEITGAELSRSPLSAPAWSLQRVKIHTRRSAGFQLVSPVNREAFLNELMQRVGSAPTRK